MSGPATPYQEKLRLRDGWSSFTDTEADNRTLSDQFFLVRDLLSVRVEKLDAKGYSTSFAEELAKDLSRVRKPLAAFDSGLQFSKDLSVANQLVATRADHRNVAVMRFCLQQLAAYVAEIAATGEDKSAMLIVAFNELAALHKKPLLSENLFTVPEKFRVDFYELRCENTDADASSADSYLSLSQTMLSIYRGENRASKLKQLSESFERIADRINHRQAKSFWQLCSAYTQSVEMPAGELRPALFKIYKEIETVLVYATGDDQAPVLGMQQLVDRLLCNMLCYLAGGSEGTQLPAPATEFSFGSVFPELNQLSDSTPEPLTAWLQSSIRVLTERLQHCATLLSETTLQSDESLAEFLEEIGALKRLLVVIGVHGVRANLEEIEGYLRESVSSENIRSSSTSIQLVEQQMLYQFPGITEASAMDADITGISNGTAQGTDNHTADESTPDFGARCNSCIDVIQHSLDTALGSSGNLIPDSSVINALSKLINIVSDEGIDELTGLLTPLSQLLTKAENSTLNQSETLLVQEAIIAATLGIDSLVGQKPMPDLIHDVTGRVENVLTAASQRLGSGASRNSALNGFLVEAEELLPRLFELFQRLRGAPDGASHLYGDINRLLHTFKHSAEEADEHNLASLVHYLESLIVDLTHGEAPPSQTFFDLALESIECLHEDTERLRNSESAEDRSDLVDRLKIAGAADRRPLSRSDLHLEQHTGTSLSGNPDHLQEETVTDSPEANTGVIVLDESVSDVTGVDWPQRLQQLEAQYEAINSSHNKLVELQSKFDQTIQSVSKDPGNAVTADHFHLFAEQLQQVVKNQTSAVRQLGLAFSTATTIEAALLGSSLKNAVASSAKANELKVQLKFEPGHAVLHRSLFETLSEALDALLRGVVAYTIPAPSKRNELATITVSVQQNPTTTIIEVADDGCGVTVQGAVFRTDNPWHLVTRSDWRETDAHRRIERPTVWSTQSDHQIDVSGLIDIATKLGGSVAVCSDKSGSRYRLSLPELTRNQEVLVFEVSGRQLAVAATDIDSVGLADSLDALSLSHLLNLKEQTTTNMANGSHSLVCKTSSGLQRFLVDNVIGHQMLEFDCADRILPDVPGFKGVATDESGQILLLLDTDYWVSQPG